MKMDGRHYIIILVLGSLFPAPVSAVCPYNVEACHCGTALISCRNLDTMPPLVSGNVDGNFSLLYIQSGKVNSIPENSLPPNLNSIAIQNVPINYISPDAFSTSSNTLEYVSLDNISYHELPEALLTVRNLTYLGVSNMVITNWNTTILEYVAKTVYTITFRNVSLTIWPEWFRYFTLVTSVDMSQNGLSSLPADAFSNVLNLTTLNLEGNQLKDDKNLLAALHPAANSLNNLNTGGNDFTSIPQGLSVVITISTLDSPGNNIQEITADRIPVQLRELDISSNQIKQLTDTSFPNTSSLQILTLDRNPLTNISKLAFQPLQHLRTLSLKSTALMKIPLALSTLKNLNILKLETISQLHCDCPRDDQLVLWYQSQKNMTTSGYCNQRDFDINLYFRNDTFKTLCSGYDHPVGSLRVLLLLFVNLYFVDML